MATPAPPSHHGGGGGAAANQAALPQRHLMVRRAEQAVVLWGLCNQLRFLPSSPGGLAAERFYLLLALRIACLAGYAVITPRAWLRYRAAIIFLARAAACLLMRTASGGTAVLLDYPASPGTAGAMRDWLRAVTGTRLLEVALSGAILHLSPLTAAVQQAALILLVLAPANGSFCSSPLMTDPLMLRRLAALWDGLELLPAAPLALGPVGVPGSSAKIPGSAAQPLLCLSVFAFHQVLLGIFVPTVVAALALCPADPLCPAAHGVQQQERQQSAPPPPQCCGWLRAAAYALQHAAAAACRGWAVLDCAVWAGCRALCSNGLQLAVTIMQLPGALWLLCRVLAARTLAVHLPF